MPSNCNASRPMDSRNDDALVAVLDAAFMALAVRVRMAFELVDVVGQKNDAIWFRSYLDLLGDDGLHLHGYEDHVQAAPPSLQLLETILNNGLAAGFVFVKELQVPQALRDVLRQRLSLIHISEPTRPEPI
eukprot:8876481-Pyramimonas_sp.AAC.1